jgi:hypothetical protein
MAEIRVEPKRRSLTWLWVLLAVLVIAALVWYFLLGGAQAANAPTSAIEAPLRTLAEQVRQGAARPSA